MAVRLVRDRSGEKLNISGKLAFIIRLVLPVFAAPTSRPVRYR
jgi:hypothetical protein